MYKVYGNTVIAVFLTLASSVPLTFNPFKREFQEVKYFHAFKCSFGHRVTFSRKDTRVCMSHNRVLVTVRDVIIVSTCIVSTELLVR